MMSEARPPDVHDSKQSSQPGSEIVVVTGPSGAGRTTAIRALEDAGFEAIDNFPLSLIPRLFAMPDMTHPIVFGIDARNRDFSPDYFFESLKTIHDSTGRDPIVVFLACSKDALIRRYSETRRRHPMSRNESLNAGIEHEMRLLSEIKSRADVLIDTSSMSPHDLRAEILRQVGPSEEAEGLAVAVTSFSYKRGIPRSADMVIDARFLRNPHWQEGLRELTGLDEKVQDYVSEDAKYADFFSRLCELVLLLLPAYCAEGKSYFTLAIGCSGGRHRSVTIVEHMVRCLADNGWNVSVRHRELECMQVQK